jgi:hypothetical protein
VDKSHFAVDVLVYDTATYRYGGSLAEDIANETVVPSAGHRLYDHIVDRADVKGQIRADGTYYAKEIEADVVAGYVQAPYLPFIVAVNESTLHEHGSIEAKGIDDRRGLGPLMYDTLMQMISWKFGKAGWITSGLEVSNYSFRVWDFYFRKREDVRKALLSTLRRRYTVNKFSDAFPYGDRMVEEYSAPYEEIDEEGWYEKFGPDAEPLWYAYQAKHRKTLEELNQRRAILIWDPSVEWGTAQYAKDVFGGREVQYSADILTESMKSA